MLNKTDMNKRKYNYNFKETFNVSSSVSMENSSVTLDSAENEKLTITVAVDSNEHYGYFEIYDHKTGGNRFYGEGGLWFEKNELVDFDGVYDLSNHVIKKLVEWGFKISSSIQPLKNS